MKALLYAISLPFITPCYAECRQDAAIAVKFMNQYLAYNQAIYEKRTAEPVSAWLKRNPLVSPTFPKSYEANIREGLKIDPQLGWNVDPILDAQDSPEKGIKLFECAQAPGFVILQGTDWPEFKVTVNVIHTNNGPKVSGAGMVNIPKIQRAPR